MVFARSGKGENGFRRSEKGQGHGEHYFRRGRFRPVSVEWWVRGRMVGGGAEGHGRLSHTIAPLIASPPYVSRHAAGRPWLARAWKSGCWRYER